MITAKGIFKSYGKVDVLKNIDLHVSKGEIVSIVGPSGGAGKSTLLQILGTIEQADQGTLMLDDRSISGLTGKALAAFRNQKKSDLCFSFTIFFPSLPRSKIFAFLLLLLGNPKSKPRKRP